MHEGTENENVEDFQFPKTYDDDTNACVLCCKRLCATKFEDESLRSKSAAMSEEHRIKLEKDSEIRGRWANRIEFLLSCIGFAVGLGNVWRFPIRVYEGGGGAFLIPYSILCLILGTPLLLLEMGLGQFSGRSPVKAFKLVPVLYGIGWCMFFVNVFINIYYGVIMAWSYFYLFGSLNPTMSWTVCSHNFNTKSCLESKQDHSKLNKSLQYVSSTAEYWDYYVTGFIKYPSREMYTMNEFPGAPQWHLTLCLLIVWFVAAISLMFGVKVSGKIIYFSALFPYVVITFLIILGCTLPGAGNGVKFYLKPDWSKMFDPKILRGAIEQLFFSSSIAMGGMITFSSYNDFRDNIYRDAIIVIFADFFTSFLAGFAVFPILGYMAHRNGVHITKVITSGSGLFFITYPEALATIPGSNLWTFLFMLMAISLGMDSQFAMMETIITGIVDTFPTIRQSKLSKAIFVCMACFCFFLCGILLCTPAGTYYFDILDLRVSSYGLPLVALMEAVAVGLIYGFKQFRYDFRMMVGFSLPLYWFVTMAFVCPVIIFLILIASLIQYDRITVRKINVPIWGEFLAFMFLLIMISPLFICAVHTIVSYRRKYPELRGTLFIKKLFEAPIYWGPLYLNNWLLGNFYREKMIKYKDDPKFIHYLNDFKNLDHVIQIAMQGGTETNH